MKYIKKFKIFEINSGELYLKQHKLIFAVIDGDLDKVKDILNNSKNIINDTDYQSFTPLAIAAYKHNLELVKLLIDNDADWNIKTEFNNTFFEILTPHEQDIIKNEYPEKYNNYQKKQKSNNFNL